MPSFFVLWVSCSLNIPAYILGSRLQPALVMFSSTIKWIPLFLHLVKMVIKLDLEWNKRLNLMDRVTGNLRLWVLWNLPPKEIWIVKKQLTEFFSWIDHTWYWPGPMCMLALCINLIFDRGTEVSIAKCFVLNISEEPILQRIGLWWNLLDELG